MLDGSMGLFAHEGNPHRRSIQDQTRSIHCGPSATYPDKPYRRAEARKMPPIYTMRSAVAVLADIQANGYFVWEWHEMRPASLVWAVSPEGLGSWMSTYILRAGELTLSSNLLTRIDTTLGELAGVDTQSFNDRGTRGRAYSSSLSSACRSRRWRWSYGCGPQPHSCPLFWT